MTWWWILLSVICPCKSRGTDSREFLPGLLWYKWDQELAPSDGRKKGEKESKFSFLLCSVHGLGWDRTLHNSSLCRLQQGQQKSQSIWLRCNTNKMFTLEGVGHLAACQKSSLQHFRHADLWQASIIFHLKTKGKLRQGMQWACLRAAVSGSCPYFYVYLHYAEVAHCLGNLNFLCHSFWKYQAPSQTTSSIRLPYFSLTWGPVLLRGAERVSETFSKEALRFPWSQQELTGLNTLRDCV